MLPTEKYRELREWGTFWLSFATAVAIPIGLLILKNQRLEIESAVAERYVSKEAWLKDKSDLAEEDKITWKKVTEIGVKLDDIRMDQVRMQDSISSIKEALALKGMKPVPNSN